MVDIGLSNTQRWNEFSRKGGRVSLPRNIFAIIQHSTQGIVILYLDYKNRYISGSDAYVNVQIILSGSIHPRLYSVR